MLVIRDATPEDAPFLAECIMAGMHFYDFEPEMPEDKADIFRRLTECERMTDTIYSYARTRVAEYGGRLAGALLSYPGEIYREARRKTFAELWPDLMHIERDSDQETEAGEYYLDSLAVVPQFRRTGIGRRLIEDGAEKGLAAGFDRITLVADIEMPGLVRYYESLGFSPLDRRFAFGTHFLRMVRRMRG